MSAARRETLRFAYYQDTSNIWPDIPVMAMYYLRCGTGHTQIDAPAALANGYQLGPTPSYEEWKLDREKRRRVQNRPVCGIGDCRRPLRNEEDRRWHVQVYHRRVAA